MSEKKTILLTGHTGFVGQYLVEIAQLAKHAIVGLSRSISPNVKINIQKDLSTLSKLDFLDDYKLDGIIHLAANSNVNACEENPQLANSINVQASILLANYAKQKNLPFVFASSDQVFDGEKGNYSPSDEAIPLNQYGKQKIEAEQGILKLYPDAVVCRLPLMIGEKGGYEKAFVENLKAGKKQNLFTDEIRSVSSAADAAKGMLSALEWQGGLYHLGGPKDMNRYELGMMLATKHGLDTSLIFKSVQSDVKMLASRPKNATMVARKREL